MIRVEYFKELLWNNNDYLENVETKLNQIGRENIIGVTGGGNGAVICMAIMYDDVNLTKEGTNSEPLPENLVYCKSCGKPITNTDLFCPFCKERQF